MSRSRCRLTVTEGRAMIDAAKKYERVVQVGLQRRSSPAMREACEFIRKGGIGKVTVAAPSTCRTNGPRDRQPRQR